MQVKSAPCHRLSSKTSIFSKKNRAGKSIGRKNLLFKIVQKRLILSNGRLSMVPLLSGVTVAQQILDLFVKVRILAEQPRDVAQSG